MSQQVLIIGGGHNGLVCAAYLARAGNKVTVLEKRHVLGGAAVTEEFHPGFRNSVCSYTVSLLHPKIISDLNLHQHGLQIIPRAVNNFLPLPDGDSFAFITGNLDLEVGRYSQKDVEALKQYESLLSSVVPVIKEIMEMTPPAISRAGISDLLSLFRLSRRFSKLDRKQQQFLLTLCTRSSGEILDDFFETPALKALLGFDAIVGNYVSPYTPGNGYNLLHHLVGEVNGEIGRWGHALGGMGSISDAIVSEGKMHGVTCHTSCTVEKILLKNNKVRGVETADGVSHTADVVVANINPVLLFTKMFEKEQVPDEWKSHFKQFKCGSGSFRLNIALNGLPEFPGRKVPDYLTAGIILGHSLEYMEAAWHSARDHGWSDYPVIEMLIPSLVDTSLAPAGCHVASLFCQHFSPDLKSEWDKQKEQAVATILKTVEASFPGFNTLIEGIQVLSPWDLEQEFGLSGGDIFHGRMTPEQLFSARPALGLAQYEMPFKGLYLCGSGAHPGGGVSGLPGYNAARRILGR